MLSENVMFFYLFLRTKTRNIFWLLNVFSIFFYFEGQKIVLKNNSHTNPKYLYNIFIPRPGMIWEILKSWFSHCSIESALKIGKMLRKDA